jgi:uncharacterized C2H2 Zn-finger protein
VAKPRKWKCGKTFSNNKEYTNHKKTCPAMQMATKKIGEMIKRK